MYNIEKAVITCGGGCGPSQQAEGGRGGRKTGSLGSVWQRSVRVTQWDLVAKQMRDGVGGALQELYLHSSCFII